MKITKRICKNCPGKRFLECNGEATCKEMDIKDFIQSTINNTKFSHDGKEMALGVVAAGEGVALFNKKHDFVYVVSKDILTGKKKSDLPEGCPEFIETEEQAQAAKRIAEEEFIKEKSKALGIFAS